MFAVKVISKLLDGRLDAGFYRPDFLELIIRLNQLGAVPLITLVDGIACGPFGGNAIADELYAEEGVAFIRPVNISSLVFDESSLVRVPRSLLFSNKLKIYDGKNLYFGRVGDPCVALIRGETSISPNIIIAITNQDTADPYFLYAFCSSEFGLKQLLRQLKTVAQPTTSTEAIKGLLVLKPAIKAQTYIGDKVRQAEQLRTWVKRLEEQLDNYLLPYQPVQKTAYRMVSKVSPELLTDMLTASTYRDHYINNQKNLRSHGQTISLFDLLDSVTNGFDERTQLDEGLPYVKIADVKPGYINILNSPKVRPSALDEASAKQKPKIGDLLLTRKGSFGIAAVVMESTDFLCSSEVFCCKPNKKEFMPILAWFLNSAAGNMQFWQFSTGTTMPGINQENLANIVIPDFSAIDLTEFNRIYEQRFLAKKIAELNTVVAKLLVEAIIEGQIDENLLISAQDQIQTGDDSLDRSILARMKTDGLDGKGQSLFPDIDQLYALLTQAAQA